MYRFLSFLFYPPFFLYSMVCGTEPMCHTLKHMQMPRRGTSTYVCVFRVRERFFECRHTTSRWVLGALAGCCVCLCVRAIESYLCHHEYVIKLPLRKDDVSQQGVHEAGTRLLFCFQPTLVVAIVLR